MNSETGFSSYYLSDLYIKERNLETAVNKLNKINSSSIMYLSALLKKYSIFEDENKDLSSKIFNKIKKDFYNNDRVNLIIANKLRKENKCNEAIEIYDKLIRENKLNKDFKYFKGSCLEKINKWTEAKEIFENLIRDNPNDAYSMNYLSYSMAIRDENLDEAKKIILKAIKLRKNNGFFIDTLGWIEFKLHNYQKALEHLQYAVRLEPNSSEILDHLGDIYFKLDRKREATYEWKKALDGDGDEKLLKKIKVKINENL